MKHSTTYININHYSFIKIIRVLSDEYTHYANATDLEINNAYRLWIMQGELIIYKIPQPKTKLIVKEKTFRVQFISS